MARRERRPHAIDMYRAITQLKTEEECFAFFQDICSNKEMLAMEQRFRVAQMLEEGKTYLEIQEETGASTATISRVGKVLNEGTGVVAGILERKQEQDSGQEHDAGQKRDSGQKREENE